MKQALNNKAAFVKNAEARLIIVLGLPASGKTTYCNTHFLHAPFHYFDDAMFKSDLEIVLQDLLEKGQCVVVVIPDSVDLEHSKASMNCL